MVGRHVSAILAGAPPAVVAAKAATTTIPIVFTSGGNPVELGLVSSLSHPGGNVTGVSFLTDELGCVNRITAGVPCAPAIVDLQVGA